MEISFNLRFFFICVDVWPVYMSVQHMDALWLRRPEDGIKFPETRVKNGYISIHMKVATLLPI